MNAFKVLNGGPQTTVQDTGRPALRRYGIPSSGAMDQFSHRVANRLAANPENAATLEIMLFGFTVEAMTSLTLAIAGGDLGARLNDQPAPLWTPIGIKPGDRLSFTGLQSGCRAYLAVGGGFGAPEFLGSRSTFLKGHIGSAIKTGDLLSAGQSGNASAPLRPALPEPLRRPLPPSYTIRVILGPQTEAFTARGLETFLHSSYAVSPRSDRQGIRTEGPAIETVKGPDIITDPTPLGAIQVPGDGRPIILHRDGQVTGGYAKIATVISADLDWFGQMMAGDALRFQAVTRDEALGLARQYRQRLSAVAEWLGNPSRA